MMTWTQERTEQLVQLAGKGLAASQIAALIGGITRNAVIGKWNRLGIVRAKLLKQPKPKTPRKRKWKSMQTPPLCLDDLPLDVKQPDLALVKLVDLTFYQCRWPIGDPQKPDFGFCGAPIALRSYCAFHARMAVTRKNGSTAATSAMSTDPIYKPQI